MPEKTERLAEIVEQLLEASAEQRGALMAELCGDNADLRREVESLLGFQEKARDFIEAPAYELAAQTFVNDGGELEPGQLLGEYKIISLLGEGGMGEVYLAEDTALGREVALKLVKRGFGTAEFVRHFRQEERILAGLNHPNIARLYGAAVTSDGVPYFVMEYVAGARLDHYCRENKLSVPERLALFRKVCSAIAFAHQNLVIHRDIKPANIRVTPEGEPKLLDFGIAKLLDPQTSEVVEQTMTLQGVMTPEYASPEQVRGERVTTASDVYSLGVVLYELLTEQKPYRIDQRTPANLARAIAEQEPTRPSTAIAKRSGFPQSEIRNSKSLRGDLDNIVLMAMRKEPERRYASVDQLSEDIRRHLDGLPVIAQKDTFNYRAAKFISRHRVGVAAAVLVFLALVGGIIAIAFEAHRADRQRARAEQRFNEVRRLANSLMFEIHDSVQNLEGSTPTRRLIVSRALEYLDSLAKEAADNPSLQRELATAYEKIGDIQGNPYSANLGDTNGALASYRKATAIREALSKVQSTVATEMEMGRSYRAVGDILEQKGDIAGMVENYRRSLSIFDQLASSHGEDFSVQDELARAYEVLGDGLKALENSSAEKLDSYNKALSIRQRLLSQNPTNAKLRRSIGLNFLKVGAATEAKSPEASKNIHHGIDLLEKLAAEDPENARAKREVGFANFELGNSRMEAGDYAGALEARRKAFAIREQIAAQDPKNSQARFDLAVAHGDLAEALNFTGETAQALEEAKRSLKIFEEVSAADPTNVAYRRNVGLCYEKFAEVYARLATNEKNAVAQRLHDWNEARTWYQKEMELFSTLGERGTLRPADSEQTQKIAAKMAAGQTAMDRLSRSAR
jgi:serine/threonine protein kinase